MRQVVPPSRVCSMRYASEQAGAAAAGACGGAAVAAGAVARVPASSAVTARRVATAAGRMRARKSLVTCIRKRSFMEEKSVRSSAEAGDGAGAQVDDQGAGVDP